MLTYFVLRISLVDPVSNMEMQACRNVERINKMKISVNLKTISNFVFINKIDIFIQISNGIVSRKSFELYELNILRIIVKEYFKRFSLHGS